MSIQQEIARLTGTLDFKVKGMPQLKQFQANMDRAGKELEKFAQKYGHLENKLGKAIKVAAPDMTAFKKALAEYDRALGRQATAEGAVSRQRRAVFQKELATRKLLSTGTKEDTRLQLKSMDEIKARAVATAKAVQAHGIASPTPKTRGRPASPQKQLLNEQAKLARIQAIHAKTQERAMMSQAKLAGQMSKNQLLYMVQQAHVTDQQTKATKERHRIEDRAARAQRTAENHAERRQRFEWATARQSHWEAQRNAPRGFLSRVGGIADGAASVGIGAGVGAAIRGVGAFAAALGPVGIALAGLTVATFGVTKAFEALDARAQAREETVKKSEAYNASFNALSQDQNVRDQWRKRFMETQSRTGGAIDVETAKDFRTFVSTQQAFGKTQDQTMKAWEDRGKFFTIAGASKDDRREVNRQLNQMQADGTGDKADWNIISERVPMLAPAIAAEFAKDNKIKGTAEQQMAAFVKHLKKGKGFEYKWVERAMLGINAEKDPMFKENLKSVTNARQQQENKEFIQENLINSDAELTATMKERIAAQEQLTEAMYAWKEVGKDLDEVFTSAATSMIKFGADTLDVLSWIIPGMENSKERKARLEKEAAEKEYRTSFRPTPYKAGVNQDAKDMKDWSTDALKLKGNLPGSAAAPLIYPKATLDTLTAPPQVPTMATPVSLPDSLVPRDQLTVKDIKDAMQAGLEGAMTDKDGNSITTAPMNVNVNQEFHIQMPDPATFENQYGRLMRDAARGEFTQQIENARARQKDN